MAAVDTTNENGHQQRDASQHPPNERPTPSNSNCSTPTTVMHLEPRPFRPFKSSEEYLWAMKEDLAEWLNALYDLDVVAENFMEKLETGVTLCQHANSVRKMAIAQQQQQLNGNLANNNTATAVNRNNGYRATNNAKYEALGLTREVVYRADVPPGTFHARDNVSNFIAWCRSLGIYECLLFETDDLVMRKNERSFILCLLEVARQGAAVGMPVPMLVQMEHEIDREIEKEKEEEERRRRREQEKAFCCSSSSSEGGIEEEEEEDVEPPPQIITNDLKSLDEMVRDLVNRCSCPVQFPMIRVSEGKYRIGDTQVLIFVRILRSHVMVRVGGGWDTLEHYLDKHDPCRCRQGHRFTVASKLMIKHSPNPAQTQMQVTYERSPDPFRVGLPGSGGSSISPARVRRASIPSIHGSRASLNSIGSDKDRLTADKMRRFSGDHSAAILAGFSSAGGEGLQRSSSPGGGGDAKLSTCDKSSEHSDEGYQSGSRVSFKVNRHFPQKLLCLTETGLIDAKDRDGNNPSREYPGSSECSSVVSPESPCSLGEEPTLMSQKSTSVVNSCVPQQDGRRKSSIPTKVSKIPIGSSVVDVYNSQKARRFSGDKGMSTISAGKGHMTRSRSQCSEDSEMAAYLGYNRPGRGSLRLPRSSNGGSHIPRVASSGNNTWSHRQRESRPALTPELFLGRPPRAAGGSHSPSPHRRKVVTPRTSPSRSLQSSPSKNVSPLLQQVLAAAGGPEEILLQKMAELVQQHYGSPKLSASSPEDVQPQPPTEMIPGENYTKYWLATSDHAPRNRHSSGSQCLDSPEEVGGSGDSKPGLTVASQPASISSKIPIRVSPRRDSVAGSTRIPMPTYYNS